jgi:hypothetical protein
LTFEEFFQKATKFPPFEANESGILRSNPFALRRLRSEQPLRRPGEVVALEGRLAHGGGLALLRKSSSGDFIRKITNDIGFNMTEWQPGAGAVGRLL